MKNFNDFIWYANVDKKRYGSAFQMEFELTEKNINEIMPYIFKQIQDSLIGISKKHYIRKKHATTK